MPERTVKLVDGIPGRYRSLALKVISGEATNSARIKFNCQQCVGWEEIQERVGGCRVFACAFWGVRPYQTQETSNESQD